MNIQENVPFCLADIDAAWLTYALQESGVLESGHEVTGFSHRIIGEETGFLGEVAILNLEYSGNDTEAPQTMVLKIPTALKNRVMGQTMGVYEKEIRFYNTLKKELKVRVPDQYYSALSAVDDPDVVLERLKGLNRLPLWLISLLATIVRFAIGRMPRRYVLLIEDVSRLRLGDQHLGCSEKDVRLALNAMARLHAQFWGSENLDKMTWIPPADITAKLIHMTFLQAVGRYRKAGAGTLSPRQIQLLDWIQDNGIQLNAMLGRHPRTLLHGDFRLDNLCFDDVEDEVLILDWQTMISGSAGLDLAYFLSAAVPMDATETRVDELIEYYRQCLDHEGVSVSAEHLRWMYELGMLAMLHRIAPILFQEQLELGSERGPEVMQDWIDKTYQRLANVDVDGILERTPAGL